MTATAVASCPCIPDKVFCAWSGCRNKLNWQMPGRQTGHFLVLLAEQVQCCLPRHHPAYHLPFFLKMASAYWAVI